MLRGETLRGLMLLLSTLPITMANSFVTSPGVVRGDVTWTAALEWTLQSEPDRYDLVGFTFNGADVFRYIPYTGAILRRVFVGPGGYPVYTNASSDPRFTIYNTSARGVGFRLEGLRPEDAANYTCKYESPGAPTLHSEAVLSVYDVPGRPIIELSPQTLVEGVMAVSLGCGTSSTSLPVAYRPAILYKWSRNGVYIDRTAPPERHAVLGDSGQILKISPVHHTDTTYTCTASETGTQLTSEEAEVTLDILHSTMDAHKYTMRANNLYGTGELTVEVTLYSSPAPSPLGDNFMVVVASAAAGGVLLLLIIVVTAIVCVRRKRKPASEYANSEVLGEPGHPVGDYVNSEVFREPGSSMDDYVNSEVSREPGHPMGDYVNSEVVREPGHSASDYVNSKMYRGPTSAGHQPTDASGHYECMDMATRQPADPINRVYAALQQ